MKFFMATALVALTVCGAALAQAPATVSTPDPTKAFSFDRPAKWPAMDEMSKPSDAVRVFVSGTANEECYFDLISRPETVSAPPANIVKSFSTPIEPAKWVEAMTGQALLRDGVTTVETSGVDTSKLFPFQTAILKGSKNRVIAAIHARPGIEIWVMCTAYDGKDHTASFQAIAGSLTTPKDAEYKAALEGAKAAPPAPAAAAPPAKPK